MPFNRYAEYYNLLYRDKDYAAEVDYASSLLATNGVTKGSLLELGCGTGRHAYLLSTQEYRVHGIDMSETMLEIAQKEYGSNSSLCFEAGDVRTYRTEQRFDAVISLFHVMSYQSTNNDIRQALATAAAHLSPGGLFLFDYWYGPAVLTLQPENRFLELEDQRIVLARTAKPDLLSQINCVDVNYDIHVRNKETGLSEKCRETHRMRYFFLTELELLLNDTGFEILSSFKWMSDEEPNLNSWCVCTICRKITEGTNIRDSVQQ